MPGGPWYSSLCTEGENRFCDNFHQFPFWLDPREILIQCHYNCCNLALAHDTHFHSEQRQRQAGLIRPSFNTFLDPLLRLRFCVALYCHMCTAPFSTSRPFLVTKQLCFTPVCGYGLGHRWISLFVSQTK